MLLLCFELDFALLNTVAKRCINPWSQVTMETRFFTVAGNIYSLVRNMLYVVLLAPKILRCVLDF
jgi:predicted methyltransferase